MEIQIRSMQLVSSLGFRKFDVDGLQNVPKMLSVTRVHYGDMTQICTGEAWLHSWRVH